MSEDVIVARGFKEPIDVKAINDGLVQHSWCLDVHRVNYRWSYFAKAGNRLLCRFSAPDAESVRMGLRLSPPRPEYAVAVSMLSPDPASVDAPPNTGTDELVVVERFFEAPIELSIFEEAKVKGRWCAEQYRVRALRTYLGRDRQRVVCLFAAPDAEAVRQVQAVVGMPYDAVWTAQVFLPPS